MNTLYYLTAIFLFTVFSNELMYSQTLLASNDSHHLPGEEYFIMDPNVKLVYNSTFGDTECITQMDGETYIQEFIGRNFRMMQQLTLNKDNIKIIRLEQELKVLFVTAHSININYSEPAKLASFPISKERKSEWQGLEYSNDSEVDTIIITSEYLGNETILTDAGKFECIKLEYVITKKSGTNNKYYEWRAPNIGLVQLTAQVDPNGFTGLMMDILGISEIYFILKEIKS